MWKLKSHKAVISSLVFASLFIICTDSLGTQQGKERALARQKRAGSKWSSSVYTPSAATGNSNAYQQQIQQAQAFQGYNPQASQYSPQYASYPTNSNAASYQQQYPSQVKNSAYSTPNQAQAYNQYQSANPAASATSNSYGNQQYRGNQQQYPTATVAGNGAASTYVDPTKAAYYQAAGFVPNRGFSTQKGSVGTAAGYGQQPGNGYNSAANINNPYPSVQSSFGKNQYARPGSQEYLQGNYPLYEDPNRTPMQYNFNGYNPYGQQTNGANQQQQGYNQQQFPNGGQARTGPALVTPSPAEVEQQYNLKEFCQKPDREPKCKKNSFGMCDYQDNYPSEVATEFYAYYKSRITAMTADYDYTSSDQYDTGFATQQNKLIDFVHDIFDDNEYGALPGVPVQKKGICIGVSDTMQPGWAKTTHGKNLVVMNSNNVKQTIRAEVCKNVGKGCETVPKCYRSECRQRYRYDILLVFDPCDSKHAPMLELFKIPDGCECFVIVEEPDLTAGDSTPSIAVTKRTSPTSTSTTTTTATTSTISTTTTPSPIILAGRSGDFDSVVPSTSTQTTPAINAMPTTTSVVTVPPSTTTAIPATTPAVVIIHVPETTTPATTKTKQKSILSPM